MSSKKNYYKQKMMRRKEEKKEEPETPRYRDRAKERREDQNPDYEPTELGPFHAVPPPGTDLRLADAHKISIEKSGLEHTHLVKGLDYALPHKVRSEIEKKPDAEEGSDAESSVGQSSKRFTRDYSIDGPRKKISKTPSIDDIVDVMNAVIKKKRQELEDVYAEEIAEVKEILAADGYSKHDVVFMQVLNLCRHRPRRLVFLNLKTKESRLKWVKWNWPSTRSDANHHSS